MKLVSIQVCSTFLGVNLWPRVTGGIMSMSSRLEWWCRQIGDNWRQWKNGGVSGIDRTMEELGHVYCVHRNKSVHGIF